jgi:DNA helicase IV
MTLSSQFLLSEWCDVIDSWQIETWDEYRDVARLGRKTRLGERQRESIWKAAELVRQHLADQELVTMPQVFRKLEDHIIESGRPPFDFAIVDEAQDVSIPQLRFLGAIGSSRPNGLFFAGDLGQRIFQQPYSWLSLGVDVRGRSSTLRVCYRTTHQIRRRADKLLPPAVTDVDGIVESRTATTSVFSGPEPHIELYDDIEAEAEAVGRWLGGAFSEGAVPHEIGVIVRSSGQLARAQAAVNACGAKWIELNEESLPEDGYVAISTMHLAKGLEFRAVAVMACDEDVLPLQSRIEEVTDESDLEDVYDTERNLLYVACTRARDLLHVSGISPASEFLADLTPLSQTDGSLS